MCGTQCESHGNEPCLRRQDRDGTMIPAAAKGTICANQWQMRCADRASQHLTQSAQ